MNTTEKMKRSKSQASFTWMLLPLLTFVMITVAVLVERVGFRVAEHSSELSYLPPIDVTLNSRLTDPSTCLIITDGKQKDELNIDQLLLAALTQAKLECELVTAQDLTPELIAANDQFVVTFYDLDLLRDTINPLFDKISTGGGLLFAIRPDPGLTFQAIYRKMGISMKADRLDHSNGVEFKEHILLGALNTDTTYDYFHHNSLPVQLDPTAKIYATIADAFQIPLIWRADLGTGKVVVINTDQFSTIDSTGILFAAFGLMDDVFVYPVINSWTFFIDQFPGPINATQTAAIREEFGRDDRSFFINIWWPDIISLTKKYDTMVTALSIQSFTDQPKSPFPHEGEEEDYEYLSASILENNGEVGLIGYNNDPFCAELAANDETALTSKGILTAYSFLSRILTKTGETIETLAPPTSPACGKVSSLEPISETLKVLVVRPDPEVEAIQYKKYSEDPSGLVMITDDSQGYALSQVQQWRLMNYATLYYAVSGGVNSFDVIALGSPGWSALRSELDDQLLWIRSSYPAMRSLTASDTAKAAQRYARVGNRSYDDGKTLTIEIEGFVDEAWFMIVTDHSVDTVVGGSLTKVNGSKYLLKADRSVVTIEWKE